MTIKKLAKMPYAQAHIEIHENGDIALYSYVTLVAEIICGEWLIIRGLYSQTTKRHIGAFCKELANCDYQTAKQIYSDGCKMNIHTGEIVPLEIGE